MKFKKDLTQQMETQNFLRMYAKLHGEMNINEKMDIQIGCHLDRFLDELIYSTERINFTQCLKFTENSLSIHTAEINDLINFAQNLWGRLMRPQDSLDNRSDDLGFDSQCDESEQQSQRKRVIQKKRESLRMPIPDIQDLIGDENPDIYEKKIKSYQTMGEIETERFKINEIVPINSSASLSTIYDHLSAIPKPMRRLGGFGLVNNLMHPNSFTSFKAANRNVIIADNEEDVDNENMLEDVDVDLYEEQQDQSVEGENRSIGFDQKKEKFIISIKILRMLSQEFKKKNSFQRYVNNLNAQLVDFDFNMCNDILETKTTGFLGFVTTSNIAFKGFKNFSIDMGKQSAEKDADQNSMFENECNGREEETPTEEPSQGYEVEQAPVNIHNSKKIILWKSFMKEAIDKNNINRKPFDISAYGGKVIEKISEMNLNKNELGESQNKQPRVVREKQTFDNVCGDSFKEATKLLLTACCLSTSKNISIEKKDNQKDVNLILIDSELQHDKFQEIVGPQPSCPVSDLLEEVDD